MKRKLLILALSTAVLATSAAAQDLAGARRALDELVSLSARGELQTAKGRALFAGGELANNKSGSMGPMTGPDAVVATASDGAVAHFEVGAAASPIDGYMFLKWRDGAWRVDALRAMAMTGVPTKAREYLEQKPDRSAEEELILKNLRLTLATDEALKNWFSANRSELDALRTVTPAGGERLDPKLRDRLKALGLSALSRSETGGTDVRIGGVVDNTVGFLHVGAGQPPPITKSRYIWIESLGGGWCLYRTT